jgi:hypothetical protein
MNYFKQTFGIEKIVQTSMEASQRIAIVLAGVWRGKPGWQLAVLTGAILEGSQCGGGYGENNHLLQVRNKKTKSNT